jgi:hypothetical protein
MAKPYTNPETLPERFWKRVDKRSDNECWDWKGGTNPRFGYGALGVGHRTVTAHRVSWRLHFGRIPKGMHVLHKCDRPCCVAPHHLFLGTHAENMRDKEAKGRANQPIGERNSSTKLIPEEVLAIRSSPDSHKTIAKRFNISPANVCLIKTRRIWKHLP